MGYNNYHAKYYANELLKKSATNDTDRVSMSLFNACVQLNPHQVEAALFSFKSPLSKGVILADEVGLGKTIEAGLIICQYWAERKRSIIIVCPASLRKQWSLELYEKFNVPSVILETKTYNQFKRDGIENPLSQKNKVIIMSYNFANTKKEEIRALKWDLAVVDEAHKLRNAYKPKNKTSNGIKFALNDTKKLLLTATPLQNSLLELFGLTSIISDNIFGDLKSFKQQYVNSTSGLVDLQDRLKFFCKRTLRQDVTEYVPYTERKPITFPFETTKNEQELYNGISAFLQKSDSYSVPNSQRTLITNVVRKLLASSSIAVIGTLESIKSRLISLKNNEINKEKLLDLNLDEDVLELLDQDLDDESSELDSNDNSNDELSELDAIQQDELKKQLSELERNQKIQKEIDEIEHFIELAKSIKIDSKTVHLVEAIKMGFDAIDKQANKKALIFTESRRTQDYLKAYLIENGFADRVLIFNGTNSDKESNAIYKEWLEKNKDSGRISGSTTADKRNAIIEKFRDDADILIATESAAEGINLQFCPLVINYDLPWNPQRIEQRIGRCHRYGQKYDVVVLNFLNNSNETDKRVYKLLEEKFKLFEGVFGSSDQVLGALESGVDFEKKMLEIYNSCRSPEEIKKAFDDYQKEMDEKIQAQMKLTKQSVLDNFDEDVHTKLKTQLEETKIKLNKYQQLFWNLTKIELDNFANFNDNDLIFNLYSNPKSEFAKGNYYLISKDKENVLGSFLYRMTHPLGEYVLDKATTDSTPDAELTFDITNYPKKISIVEDLKGKSGYLVLNKLTIKSFEEAEYLLFNAFTDDGKNLDQEVCEKLFNVGCVTESDTLIPYDINNKLDKDSNQYIKATIDQNQSLNSGFLREEIGRLEKWAEDLVNKAENDIKSTKNKLRTLRKERDQASNTADYTILNDSVEECEREIKKLRRQRDDIEDDTSDKKDEIIKKLKEQMKAETTVDTLFKIRWKVV